MNTNRLKCILPFVAALFLVGAGSCRHEKNELGHHHHHHHCHYHHHHHHITIITTTTTTITTTITITIIITLLQIGFKP